MTHDEALGALAQLLTRAQAAVQARDVAAGEQVGLEAIWLEATPVVPTTRALAVAFSHVAHALAELVRPQAMVGLFQRAAHAFQHAPDTTFSDFIVVLNNLAAVQLQADDADAGATLTALLGLAGRWAGEVDANAARVLMQQADNARKTRQHAAMLVFQEQALRYILWAPLPDDSRAAWLRDQLEAMREAGRADLVPATLDRIEAASAARDDGGPLALGMCRVERAALREAEGDFSGAASLMDVAIDAAHGLPPRELTRLLTMASRLWFHAGEYERSAARAKRALRRRVGLGD
jgi:hypothetical protein